MNNSDKIWRCDLILLNEQTFSSNVCSACDNDFWHNKRSSHTKRALYNSFLSVRPSHLMRIWMMMWQTKLQPDVVESRYNLVYLPDLCVC